jgi:hypothetical protein
MLKLNIFCLIRAGFSIIVLVYIKMCLGNAWKKMVSWRRNGRVGPTPYPDSMGFCQKKDGSPDAEFRLLLPGMEVQRIVGGKTNPYKDIGCFMSNIGATPRECSIPTTSNQQLLRLLVLKSFPVTTGKVAPWGDGSGGATQYVAVGKTVGELVTQGYLQPISRVCI